MNPESAEDTPARATTTHVEARSVGTKDHDASSHTDSSGELKRDEAVDGEPDGGLAAWMTVAGAWLIFFVSLGLVNTFGSFQDYYARVYLSDSSISAIGWISSVQLSLMYLVGPFVGVLFDRGYFLSITLFGATLYSFSMFMLSLAQPQSYYQIFLTHGVGTGLGIGCLLLPAVSLIGQHFKRRCPLASGIAFIGASVGGIVLPQLFNHLVADEEGGLGWGNGMRVMSAVLTVCIFAGLAMMRRKAGVGAPSIKKQDAEVASAQPEEKVLDQLVRYAKEAEYVWVLLGLFILSLCVLYPLFYLQLFAALRDVPPRVTLNVVTILNACAIPGRLVPNYLSQHFGIINLLIVSSVACMAIIFGLLGVGHGESASSSIIGVAVVYGFFSGGILSQMTPALASTARNINEIGARTGVGFIGIGIASLLGPPIMGWLLTNSYIWWRVTVFSGVGMGVTAVCFAFGHVLKARRVGSRFV